MILKLSTSNIPAHLKNVHRLSVSLHARYFLWKCLQTHTPTRWHRLSESEIECIKNNHTYGHSYSTNATKTYSAVWSPLWLRHHEWTLYSFIDSDHSKATLGPNKFFLPSGCHVSCALTSYARLFPCGTDTNEGWSVMATASKHRGLRKCTRWQ